MSFLRRYWPILVLAAVPIWPLWRAVFLGEAIGPWDQFRAMAPWNGPVPTLPWDVLQADAVLQFAPWRSMVFEAWSRGELPLWNPYQLMGTPLLANSQSAGFYPPHILMGVLRVPVYPAITFLAWLHLFWAGMGVYALVRRLGGLRVGGVVAGVSFSLSAFMLAWTPLPSVTTTVSWIPWVLAAVVYLFSPDSKTRLAIIGLALSLGMMLLGGHLQFAAYGLMACALLGIWLFFSSAQTTLRLNTVLRRDLDPETGTVIESPLEEATMLTSRRRFPWPRLGSFGFAMVLGAMVAAPQLLPTIASSKLSHRQGVATEESYSHYVGGAVDPVQLSSLAFPAALGHPLQGTDAVPGITSYWPSLYHPGRNFAEGAIGIGPLAFALMAFWSRRKLREFGVAGIATVGLVGLLLAIGTPLNRLLFFGIPGWSASGSPGRAIVLFVLASSVVGGVLIKEVLEGSRRPRLAFGLILVGIMLALAALPLAQVVAGDAAILRELPNLAIEALLRAAPFILLSIALCVVALLIKRRAPTAMTLVSLSIAIGFLQFNLLSPIATGEPLESTRLDGQPRVAIVNQTWNLFVNPGALMPPNLAALYGTHDVGGYDSLLAGEAKSLLDSANRADSAPLENGNMMFIKPTASWGALTELGVTEVWSAKEIQALGTPQLAGDIFRYALLGPGRVSLDGGSAKIVGEGYDSKEIEAIGPGKLIVRDMNLPGWHARIDGHEAPVIGDPFIEIDVPPGRHHVQLTYSPPTLAFGWGLMIVALVVLGLFAVHHRKPAQ